LPQRDHAAFAQVLRTYPAAPMTGYIPATIVNDRFEMAPGFSTSNGQAVARSPQPAAMAMTLFDAIDKQLA